MIHQWIPFDFVEWCELLVCIVSMHAALAFIYNHKGEQIYAYTCLGLSMILIPWIAGYTLVSSAVAISIAVALYITSATHVSTLTFLPSQIVDDFQWIDHLIKLTLHAMNYSQSIIWIIDTKDILCKTSLARIRLTLKLEPNILDIIMSGATQHESYRSILVNSAGDITGIDLTQGAYIKKHEQLPFLQKCTIDHEAILIVSEAGRRTFSITYKNKFFEDLSSHHTHTILKNILQLERESPCYQSQTTTPKTSSAHTSQPFSDHSSGSR